MATVGMIWAQSDDGIIGDGQRMPWHLPEDLAHFQATTTGEPVIMGSRTWLSLPTRFRPLPGRQNIVVSSRSRAALQLPETVTLAHSLDAALTRGQQLATDTVWVIGGGEVYAQALPVADTLVVTHVRTTIGAGVPAPPIPADFHEMGCEEPVQSRGGLEFTVCTYRRTR